MVFFHHLSHQFSQYSSPPMAGFLVAPQTRIRFPKKSEEPISCSEGEMGLIGRPDLRREKGMFSIEIRADIQVIIN